MKPEYILCAAILLLPEYQSCDKIYSSGDTTKCKLGYRHADIVMNYNSIISKKPRAQGFYTSKNRFVSRTLGMYIAKKAGQVKSDTKRKMLFSEDLY